MDERLYFRQLLSGRDFATDDMIARQMVNFAYLIGDRQTGEAVIVDPAYDVDGLLGILETDGMTPVGVLGTHYHADHLGGNMMGYDISGVAALLERFDIPVHLQAPEVEFVTKLLTRLKLAPQAAVDEIRAQYRALDADYDGFVSVDEVKRLLKPAVDECSV